MLHKHWIPLFENKNGHINFQGKVLPLPLTKEYISQLEVLPISSLFKTHNPDKRYGIFLKVKDTVYLLGLNKIFSIPKKYRLLKYQKKLTLNSHHSHKSEKELIKMRQKRFMKSFSPKQLEVHKNNFGSLLKHIAATDFSVSEKVFLKTSGSGTPLNIKYLNFVLDKFYKQEGNILSKDEEKSRLAMELAVLSKMDFIRLIWCFKFKKMFGKYTKILVKKNWKKVWGQNKLEKNRFNFVSLKKYKRSKSPNLLKFSQLQGLKEVLLKKKDSKLFSSILAQNSKYLSGPQNSNFDLNLYTSLNTVGPLSYQHLLETRPTIKLNRNYSEISSLVRLKNYFLNNIKKDLNLTTLHDKDNLSSRFNKKKTLARLKTIYKGLNSNFNILKKFKIKKKIRAKSRFKPIKKPRKFIHFYLHLWRERSFYSAQLNKKAVLTLRGRQANVKFWRSLSNLKKFVDRELHLAGLQKNLSQALSNDWFVTELKNFIKKDIEKSSNFQKKLDFWINFLNYKLDLTYPQKDKVRASLDLLFDSLDHRFSRSESGSVEPLFWPDQVLIDKINSLTHSLKLKSFWSDRKTLSFLSSVPEYLSKIKKSSGHNPNLANSQYFSLYRRLVFLSHSLAPKLGQPFQISLRQRDPFKNLELYTKTVKEKKQSLRPFSRSYKQSNLNLRNSRLQVKKTNFTYGHLISKMIKRAFKLRDYFNFVKRPRRFRPLLGRNVSKKFFLKNRSKKLYFILKSRSQLGLVKPMGLVSLNKLTPLPFGRARLIQSRQKYLPTLHKVRQARPGRVLGLHTPRGQRDKRTIGAKTISHKKLLLSRPLKKMFKKVWVWKKHSYTGVRLKKINSLKFENRFIPAKTITSKNLLPTRLSTPYYSFKKKVNKIKKFKKANFIFKLQSSQKPSFKINKKHFFKIRKLYRRNHSRKHYRKHSISYRLFKSFMGWYTFNYLRQIRKTRFNSFLPAPSSRECLVQSQTLEFKNAGVKVLFKNVDKIKQSLKSVANLVPCSKYIKIGLVLKVNVVLAKNSENFEAGFLVNRSLSAKLDESSLIWIC